MCFSVNSQLYVQARAFFGLLPVIITIFVQHSDLCSICSQPQTYSKDTISQHFAFTAPWLPKQLAHVVQKLLRPLTGLQSSLAGRATIILKIKATREIKSNNSIMPVDGNMPCAQRVVYFGKTWPNMRASGPESTWRASDTKWHALSERGCVTWWPY